MAAASQTVAYPVKAPTSSTRCAPASRAIMCNSLPCRAPLIIWAPVGKTSAVSARKARRGGGSPAQLVCATELTMQRSPRTRAVPPD
eukprot:scaffold2109_cov123-Isochrysis_galbana.AAC.21